MLQTLIVVGVTPRSDAVFWLPPPLPVVLGAVLFVLGAVLLVLLGPVLPVEAGPVPVLPIVGPVLELLSVVPVVGVVGPPEGPVPVPVPPVCVEATVELPPPLEPEATNAEFGSRVPQAVSTMMANTEANTDSRARAVIGRP
jgi:hypothetical protein